jgi:hypothetical protein
MSDLRGKAAANEKVRIRPLVPATRTRHVLALDGCDELVCDGKKGKFQPSRDACFVKDVGEMPLYGFLAQSELLGDIAVAATFHDATNHFKLPWSEPVCFALRDSGLLDQVMERGNQVDHALSTYPIVSIEHGPYGSLQVADKGVFEHDSASADLERFNDLLGGDGGGEKENLDRRRAVHNGAHGFKAREARHLHVEEEDVRLRFQRHRDGFVAVRGIADYVKTIPDAEHIAYANADHRMVIRQYDSDWSFHLSGYPPRSGVVPD